MTLPTTQKIRDVSDIVTKGTTPTTVGRNYTSSGINFLKVETFTSDGIFIPGKQGHIDESTHQLLKRSQLAEGDILFSIAGALGRSTIVDKSWLPANTNQAFAIIRPSSRNQAINPRYLLWQLRSPAIAKRIAEINVQAAQANLSLEQVREFDLLSLPRAEQNVIAAALDDVDQLVAALERLVSKKQAIKQGLMQELLSGKTRLPGFHSPWVTYSFGHLLSYEQPGPYLVGSAEYSQSGIPVLTAGKTFVLGYTRENDGIYAELPVIIFDDFTTATQYVDFPFKAKSSAMKILTAKPGVDIRWVFEKMQNVKFNAVDHKRRWITEYSKIEIPTPSLEEQRAIAEVIRDADDEIRTLQSRLESARNIKQGMMQELLSGRTRLPVEEVSS